MAERTQPYEAVYGGSRITSTPRYVRPATAILISAGLTPSEALQRITTAGGIAVPDTEDQRHFILRFTPSAPK